MWRPFRDAIGDWLAARLLPADELVLVGPSAGHCLPLAHVTRSRHVLVLEPDPLARRILASRLRGTDVEVEARDLVLSPLLSGEPGLEALLARRPGAAVFFCNVLGQPDSESSDAERSWFESEFRRRIVPALAGRSWASFHDRWSLDRAAGEPCPVSLAFDRRPSDEMLAAAWFGDAGAPVTARDHGTAALFPEAWPRRYFSWQITPRALPVVEAVSGEI